MALKVRNWYRFGPYRLDATDRLLYRDSDLIALPPKVFDTLDLFVRNHGRVLTRDEMLKELWPDTFVEEGTLTQYISQLRKALAGDAHWIENLPRRGYRFMAPVDEFHDDPSHAPAPTPTRLPKLRIAALATLTLALAAGLVWWRFTRPEPIRSIAVLPFLNLSGNSQFDYISDGLSDELTHALTRLKGIRVAARTSAFQFRGKNEDVRRIGQRLNVAGVLEGSVRIERNRIQVIAQFVDARNGYHVWSENYEGALDDLLTIQQRIGVAVAQRLEHDVSSAGPAASSVRREVFLPYLQGRYFLAKGRPETFQKAVDAFNDVIRRDPTYARAHSGLADTYYRWALWESLPPQQAFSSARRAAEQALALDESLAEAHASLANVKFQHDWDYAAAEREFRRSIALDPNRADTWHWFSHYLTAMGRFAESLEASRKAIELDPFDLPSLNHLGWCYYFAGDFTSAVDQHRKVLELDPAHGQTRLLLGRALLQQGRTAEAVEQLRRNLELSPGSPERIAALAAACAASGDHTAASRLLGELLSLRKQRYVAAYSFAMVYTALGDQKQALHYLDQAASERSSRLVELKYEPAFKPLRAHPSFSQILRRAGL